MTRPLLLALVASVAVHALALAVAPRLAPRARADAATIDLDVIEAAPVEEPAAEGDGRPEAHAVRMRAEVPAPPANRGEPPPSTSDRTSPEAARDPGPVPPATAGASPAPAPVAAAWPAGPVLPASADGIPVAAVPPGSAAGGGSPGGVGAGPGLGGPVAAASGAGGGGSPHGAILARLRDRTAGCYPRAALRRSVEGVARVSFCVADDGAPAELRLVASSGSALLDDAAVACVVRGAAPLPGVGACVQVPIDFHLRR